MNKCKKCEVELDDHRYHLGYTECVDCSETEKYSAHQVYPHKTGGYVQPVKLDTKKNLQRMDRRSVNGGRVAKGIVADKSWDRWLKQYKENIDNPKPKRRVILRAPIVNHLQFDEVKSMVQDTYLQRGYQATLDYCLELYRDDKITLPTKSKLVDMINNQEVLPKRLRKWVQKIN